MTKKELRISSFTFEPIKLEKKIGCIQTNIVKEMLITKLKILVISLLILLLLGVASATDYYVSPTGDDANAGNNISQAWRYINSSCGKLADGDTLYVDGGNGTYNNDFCVIGANNVTVKNFNGEPLISDAGGRDEMFDLDGYNNIYVKGINVSSNSNGGGFAFKNSDNATIEDCVAWNFTGPYAFSFSQMTNSTIKNCTGWNPNLGVFAIGGYGSHDNVIENCTAIQYNGTKYGYPENSDYGISVSAGAYDNIVRDCTVKAKDVDDANFGHGIAFTSAGGANYSHDNMAINVTVLSENAQMIQAREAYNITLKDCTAIGDYEDDASNARGIRVNGVAWNITVINYTGYGLETGAWFDDGGIDNHTIIRSKLYDCMSGFTGGAKNTTFDRCIAYNMTGTGNSGNGFWVWGENTVVKNSMAVNCSRFGYRSVPSVEYSLGYGSGSSNFYNVGNQESTIEQNPLFANTTYGYYDFHLKSIEGRWNGSAWVKDVVHSPAIDRGDHMDDYNKELLPNGNRINIGIYGNTPYASKSPSSKITGKVLSDIDEPVKDAVITAGMYSTKTNDTGNYILNLPYGNYNITASASNYLNYSKEVTIEKNQSLEVDFQLEPSPILTSCNRNGEEINNFTDEKIYAKGVNFPENSAIDIYIASNAEWSDGASLGSYLNKTIVYSDDNGEFFELIWSDPTEGEYDIVADVNRDGYYNEALDAVDNVTATMGITVEITSTKILVNNLEFGDLSANSSINYYKNKRGEVSKVSEGCEATDIQYFAFLDFVSDGGHVEIDIGDNNSLPDSAMLLIDNDRVPNYDLTDDPYQLQVTAINNTARISYGGESGDNRIQYNSDGYIYAFLNTGSVNNGSFKVDVVISIN